MNCKISIVICTHNRVSYLRDAIQSACTQDFPLQYYEVVVVDNASTDNTGDAVKEFSQKYPHVHYVLESKLGIANARNRGWQEAQGEYIGWLDDDEVAPPDWLKSAWSVISACRPAMIGGPVYPNYRLGKPYWYKDEYAVSLKQDTSGPLATGYMNGGNFFVRKDILVYLKGYDPNFGPIGNQVAYGEETELQMRLQKELPNEIRYYDLSVVTRHLIREHKMKLTWRFRSGFASGHAFFRAKKNKTARWRTAKAILGLLSNISLIVLDMMFFLLRDREKYPYPQNFLYEHTTGYFTKAGYFWSMLWTA